MPDHRLTKSDFLDYRACAKALWLKKLKSHVVDWPAPTEFDRLLMADGYAVEDEVKRLVSTWPDAGACSFQREFETDQGMFARADLVRDLGENNVDLWEVKASTSLRPSGSDHVVDAAFQTLVAERSGATVRSIGIIHVNKDYVRAGEIDPRSLLIIRDVTDEVRDRMPEIENDVDAALALLAAAKIDETSCTCILKSKNQHCVPFSYFNRDVPTPSIYDLPRLSAKRREAFVAEGRFGLDQIKLEEVTASQQPVLEAMQRGSEVVDLPGIQAFLEALEYPLYFYDYETFGSAIPIADGQRPHEQIPVQVSVHRLDADGSLTHSELLTERPGMQSEVTEFLRRDIGEAGHLLSWNASFETSCNRRLSRLVPDQAGFLSGLNERTRDLMDVFKRSYVHPAFGGSTSIKKVLPVLCPDLRYDQDSVHDGAGAMEAWKALTVAENEKARTALREALLSYCKLDTLAMVEIFSTLQKLISSR
ncbi:DUF2779 domain-containing protein [Pelagibius sp.]|uniref:DUF2779 domain-containing protein n=1 Tax=Pelagibius sp. TaxID=1931238 RepID=UPI003B50E549